MKMHAYVVLALAWLALSSALQAAPVATTTSKPVPEQVAAGGIASGDEDLEVKKPTPFTDQELRVLRSSSSLPVDRLVELLQVYERLDNTAMMDALVRAILRRDPQNVEAIRVRDLVDPKEEARPAAYLESLAKEVLAGRVVEDVDSVAIAANTMTAEGRAPLAAEVLEKFRARQFAGKWFPYLDDLAYAYAEAGRYDEAEQAYAQVAADSRYELEARQEATRLEPTLKIRKRIAALKAKAGADLDRLVELSADLYRERPDDYEVVVFRIETLDRARRYPEAVSMLESMKSKSGAKDWPWQPTLAYAYYGMKNYEQAIDAFREVQKSAATDPATRLEAETMILEIRVDREVEKGMAALERGDFALAEDELKTLERDFPTHQDVLGYKAIVLAKTGHPAEAFAVLEARKREVEAQGLPFMQQDALADVYLSQKQFDQARLATSEIVSDARYDADMREAAVRKLGEIDQAELLEQGYRALQDSRRRDALTILKKLQSMSPTAIEVRVYQAEVALSYGRSVEARDDLSTLKLQHYPGARPFPGQDSLGAALLRTGDWQGAFDAYSEILTQPGYEPDDLWEATWQRREILPLIRPMFRIDLAYLQEEEGNAIQSEVVATTGWHGGWQFAAFAHDDWTRLDRSSGLFETADANRFEAGVTATKRLGSRHFVEATVGGHEDGVLYGAAVGRYANQGLGWKLAYDGNGRATDSLSLEALNGREDRVSFSVGGTVAERWLVNANVYYHRVDVGGDKIGDGYGYEGSLDYIVQTETRKRPEISIGYFGQYHKFDSVGSLPPAIRSEIRKAAVPDPEVRRALASNDEVRRAVPASFGQEVLNTLVDPETNRHGVRMTVRRHFAENWAGFIQVGGYYAFDDKTFEYTASAGVEYYLSDDIMLYAEMRYDSNGSALNTGSGVWEANLGGSVSF